MKLRLSIKVRGIVTLSLPFHSLPSIPSMHIQYIKSFLLFILAIKLYCVYVGVGCLFVCRCVIEYGCATFFIHFGQKISWILGSFLSIKLENNMYFDKKWLEFVMYFLKKAGKLFSKIVATM